MTLYGGYAKILHKEEALHEIVAQRFSTIYKKKYDCGGISKEEWETIENEFGGYL